MHHQCVAPLAANSPHSGLFRAISIASSKVRLCRDNVGRSSEWPSRRSGVVNWLAFSNYSGELQTDLWTPQSHEHICEVLLIISFLIISFTIVVFLNLNFISFMNANYTNY